MVLSNWAFDLVGVDRIRAKEYGTTTGRPRRRAGSTQLLCVIAVSGIAKSLEPLSMFRWLGDKAKFV